MARTRAWLSGHTWVIAEPKCVQAAQKQKMPNGLCTQIVSAPSVKPRYDASLQVSPFQDQSQFRVRTASNMYLERVAQIVSGPIALFLLLSSDRTPVCIPSSTSGQPHARRQCGLTQGQLSFDQVYVADMFNTSPLRVCITHLSMTLLQAGNRSTM